LIVPAEILDTLLPKRFYHRELIPRVMEKTCLSKFRSKKTCTPRSRTTDSCFLILTTAFSLNWTRFRLAEQIQRHVKSRTASPDDPKYQRLLAISSNWHMAKPIGTKGSSTTVAQSQIRCQNHHDLFSGSITHSPPVPISGTGQREKSVHLHQTCHHQIASSGARWRISEPLDGTTVWRFWGEDTVTCSPCLDKLHLGAT